MLDQPYLGATGSGPMSQSVFVVRGRTTSRTRVTRTEQMFYHVERPRIAASGTHDVRPTLLRRASLPHQLLVPRWRLGRRRARRPRGRAGAVGARGDRPPGALRRRPVRDGGPRRGDPSGHRARAGARRPVRRGPGPDRGPGPPTGLARRTTAIERAGRDGSGRRPAGRRGTGSAATGADPAAGSPGRRQGGPPRDRRGATRPAPRPPGPRSDRLPEPVPARQPGEPGRDEGRAAVPPGTPGRAHRGPRGAVGLSRRRDRPSAPGRRPRGGPGGRGGLRPAVRPGREVRSGVGWERRLRPAGPRTFRRAPGDRGGGGRVRPRARASPPARRRLARGRDRPAGRGARSPRRRHERRPLRAARGPRAPGHRHGDPPRPVGRDAGRSPSTRRRVVPQVRRGADAVAARRPGDDRRRPPDGPGLGGGDRGGRRAGDRLRGRPRVRGLPLPGLHGARWGDAVLVPRRAVPRGCPTPLPPDDAGGRPPARPRARGHRADRPGRVLPHLLGPDAVCEVARDPRPGTGERGRLDRRLRPGDHPGRPDPPQPPLRAVHQRGADDLSRRRHRLQLRAPRGGHPVRLRALRAGAHGDGLQRGDLPRPVGRA